MADADANIAPFPSPAKGRVKDPTAALRQRRHRKRKSAAVTASVTAPLDHPVTALLTDPVQRQNEKFEKANEFNSDVTVALNCKERVNKSKTVTPFAQPQWLVGHDTVTGPVTAGERRLGMIDVFAYTFAVALAGCAAYFSIRGMTVLFPGAPQAIIAMAATMEAAKLVTAGWVARRWRMTAWGWRFALMAFVVGLAAINAGGTYSQLVSAHVGVRGAVQATVETQAADLDARIEVAGHRVADLDARVSQIDAAIAEATRRGRTTGAMSIMEAQRRTRAALVDE
jgi:hypothetical protein